MILDTDALISIHADDVATAESRPTLRLGSQPREQWAQLTRQWLQRHVRWPTQRLTLAEHDDVQREIALHYHKITIDQHTVATRAAEWARHFLLALKRPLRWASSAGTPWRNRPAFVVGAGPSLDGNGHLLRQCQQYGPIVTVNTALDACLHHGVVPDVVVCVEAADLTHHFDRLGGWRVLGANPTIVLDVTTHPAHWALFPEALAIAHHEPNLIPYVLSAGGAPLNYAGSVSCAAASLSILWGASPLVLIGQDMAFTNGRMYAQGTPRSDMRVEVRGGMCHFTGSSIERHPAQVRYRKGWGGGPDVASEHLHEAVAGWFGKVAHAYGDRIINATEGGASIPGSLEVPLAAVVGELAGWGTERARVPYVQPVDAQQTRDELCRDARAVLAGTLTSNLDFPLSNMWTAPVEIADDFRALTLRQQYDRVQEAMRQGAAVVLEVLG